MSDDVHSCSYYCDRPECIKAQRDELWGASVRLIKERNEAEAVACQRHYELQNLRAKVEELQENGNRLLAVADSAVTHQKDMIEAVAGPLRDQIEELRADAERYRWLRIHSTQPTESWSTHSNPESFDAAIDAALKEKT